MLPNLNDRRKLGLVAIFNRYKYIQVGIEAAEIEPWQSDTTVQTTETRKCIGTICNHWGNLSGNDGKLAGRADNVAIFDMVYKYAAEFIHVKQNVRICESRVGIVSVIVQFYPLIMPYASSIWLRKSAHRAAS
jgi:hypothetical protein